MNEDNLPPSPPPQDPTPPSVPPSPPTGGPSTSENQWATGIHLSGLLGVLGCSFPGINVIGPLVIWLLKKPESAYLDAVGKRVINFQISWAIYLLVGWVSVGALSFLMVGFLLIPLMGVAFIGWLIFTIMGAIKESNGEPYEFPLTIEFLK